MKHFFLLLTFLSGAVCAQHQEIQKLLIQRDQQSADFALQLRQSQEALKVAPANRAAFESRQISDRQRLENLNAQQLLDVKPHAPQTLRPQERQRMEVERRPFMSPIVEVPVPPAPPPAKMEPSLKGNIDVIEAPR